MYPAPPVTRICTDEPILLEARALPAKPSGVGRAAFGEVRSHEGFADGSRRWVPPPGIRSRQALLRAAQIPLENQGGGGTLVPGLRLEQIAIGRRRRTRRERLRRLRGAVTREASRVFQAGSDDIATRGSGHCPHCAGVSRLTPGKPPEPSRHIGSWSAARPRQASSSLASRRPGISVRGRVVKRSGLRLREESKLCPIPPRRAATTVTIRFCAHPRLLGSRSLLARWKDRHQGRANCSPTGSAQQYQGSVR